MSKKHGKITGKALVLIVDDVEMNREILNEILSDMGCDTMLAESGAEALEKINAKIPDLVLSDISMPGMDGYELCGRIKANVRTRGIPVIFISAFDKTEDMIKGFELGGSDYITKPFIPELVKVRVNVHLTLHDATQNIIEVNRRLQTSVNEQIRQIEQERRGVLYALAGVASKNSQYGDSYIERMSYNCHILAQSMQLSPMYGNVISDNFIDTVSFAAPLCDIGNIGIPKDILQKKTALSDEEWEIMSSHTNIGTKILKDLNIANDYNDFMQISMDITHCHHENWDGSGYPEGKKKDEIPLAAQIVAMSGMYSALTDDRSFRKSYSRDEAIEIMRGEADKKFNPDIFNIFCKVARQLR